MVKRYTTSREFVKWKIRQLESPNEFDPLHWYLALIATEIARANSKHPERIKLKDRILKFVFRNDSKSPGGEVDNASNKADAMQEQIAVSKRAWLTLAGIYKIPGRVFGNRKKK